MNAAIMTVPQPLPHSSPLIAGSVLPIKRAEELLATLPGVIAARIIASENGAVDEIHAQHCLEAAKRGMAGENGTGLEHQPGVL